MPYGKRYYKRKFKKYRRYYKKKYAKKIPRKLNNQVHAFKQTFEGPNIDIQTGITPTLRGYGISINGLADITHFTSLFDQYRINMIKLTFKPQYTNFNATANQAYEVPYIYLAVDLDTGQAPASIEELDQYTRKKIRLFNKPVSMAWKPAILSSCYNTATSTAYYTVMKRWLDAAYSTVPHYGLKVGIVNSNSASTVAQTVRVTCTLWFQFRNVR